MQFQRKSALRLAREVRGPNSGRKKHGNNDFHDRSPDRIGSLPAELNSEPRSTNMDCKRTLRKDREFLRMQRASPARFSEEFFCPRVAWYHFQGFTPTDSISEPDQRDDRSLGGCQPRCRISNNDVALGHVPWQCRIHRCWADGVCLGKWLAASKAG